MREFMLDSTVGFYRQGEVVFEKGDTGSSLLAIAEGHAELEVAPGATASTDAGSIFGQVGLISGRKRAAPTRAGAHRTSVAQGKGVSLRVELGGRRFLKKKHTPPPNPAA